MRAFDPWPGTFTTLRGAGAEGAGALRRRSGSGSPGTVLDDRLTVACGSGALRLMRVQLAGRPAMAADAFLRGHAVPAGTMLGGVRCRGQKSGTENEKGSPLPLRRGLGEGAVPRAPPPPPNPLPQGEGESSS